MQPTLVPRPIHREGWVYEEKVDGYRMVARNDGDEARFISRQCKDFTARFPELVAALSGLRPNTIILDGEVAMVRVAARAAQGCAGDSAPLYGLRPPRTRPEGLAP